MRKSSSRSGGSSSIGGSTVGSFSSVGVGGLGSGAGGLGSGAGGLELVIGAEAGSSGDLVAGGGICWVAGAGG